MAKQTAKAPVPAPAPIEAARKRKIADSSSTTTPNYRTGSVTEEQIRHLAYRKWEAAGRPEGDGVHFWLQAEQELCG